MQLAQLQAFVEVARQGSISRAAESLYLAQPTVTERLRCLETEVGEKLFTRIKYGISLTNAGKLLLPYAERVLQTVLDAKAALKYQHDGTEGDLILAMTPYFSMYVLPNVLERFSVSHPRVHVAVHTAPAADIVEAVLDKKAEVGLLRRVRHPDIESLALYRENIILVAHPSHPFCHRTQVTIEELAEERLVSYDLADSYYKLVNRIFVSVGLHLKIAFELDTVEAAKRIVEKGLGIAFLPSVGVEEELVSGRLKAIDLVDSPSLEREMVAIYLKNRSLAGVTCAFLDTLKDMYSPAPDSGGPTA